jgi:hypothetical protein
MGVVEASLSGTIAESINPDAMVTKTRMAPPFDEEEFPWPRANPDYAFAAFDIKAVALYRFIGTNRQNGRIERQLPWKLYQEPRREAGPGRVRDCVAPEAYPWTAS